MSSAHQHACVCADMVIILTDQSHLHSIQLFLLFFCCRMEMTGNKESSWKHAVARRDAVTGNIRAVLRWRLALQYFRTTNFLPFHFIELKQTSALNMGWFESWAELSWSLNPSNAITMWINTVLLVRWSDDAKQRLKGNERKCMDCVRASICFNT